MFKKILIANRGEIACRVIKTARRFGIATVAVYSEADANARHVRLADEAILIGAAPARESYLVGERILEAARQTGAEGIHPGYGFLSENAEFAEACENAGIIFIGPPASSIRAMGSKSAAKALMEKAGVPLTPGYHGDNQDPAFLAKQADAIGYPVLIKASAGGGGKGMRRVDVAGDFSAALLSCRREAANAFGDDRVLIEKYVLQPRHIEIQVFADRHGQCVYLFERDCSVQRRHQKLLEEAPAPGMTSTRRAAMGEAAVNAARAVGYVGAGTVEFIAHQDGSFYFMEMNTRLQVEHPVTEMITGQDLVEWQLRVASGEPLPRTQTELEINGHAIEARIYAEDPDKGFLPSTGRLVHLVPPAESAMVRVDTGVEEGDEITPHYDPMIAKLIVWGSDRAAALAQLRQSLADYRVVGVANNINFLSRLATAPSFVEARLDTGLIEREQKRLFPATVNIPDDIWYLAALAELLHDQSETRAKASAAADPDSPWRPRDGWRLNGVSARKLVLRYQETEQEIEAIAEGGAYRLALDGREVRASGSLGDASALRARLDGRAVGAEVVFAGAQRYVFYGGQSWLLMLRDTLHASGEDDHFEASLRAPMPGKVVALIAEPGQALEKGKPLLVLEAMKMEHTIVAPRTGQVVRFHVAAGDQVSEGAELVEFEDSAT